MVAETTVEGYFDYLPVQILMVTSILANGRRRRSFYRGTTGADEMNGELV